MKHVIIKLSKVRVGILTLQFQQCIDHSERESIANRFEQHYRTNGSNRGIQNISFKSNRVHILLKYTQDIFEDKLYVRPQNNFPQIQQVQEDKNFLNTMV